MKTINKVPVRLEVLPEGSYMDDDFKSKMEEGVVYYSPEFKGSSHRCLCGCGMYIYIGLREGKGCVHDWEIHNKEKLTITPSLLHTQGCKSHYIITNGIANFV